MPVLTGKELRIVGFLCNWCSYKEWCPAFGGDPALAPATRVALAPQPAA